MEAVEKEAASESEEDSDTEEAMRFVSQVEAMLHATHIDLNSEGMDYDDVFAQAQMDEEAAAVEAADQMVAGFWAV